MISGGVELLAGVIQDPVFGPLVAFAPGGVIAELIGDARFAVAPLTDVDASELVLGGKAGRLIAGFRGARRRTPTLRSTWSSVCPVSLRISPGVAELDLTGYSGQLNPEASQLMLAQLAWTLRQEPDIRSLRVTLGGGGTDLESYYRRDGGFIFAMALDKYIHISAHRPAFHDHVALMGPDPENVAATQKSEPRHVSGIVPGNGFDAHSQLCGSAAARRSERSGRRNVTSRPRWLPRWRHSPLAPAPVRSIAGAFHGLFASNSCASAQPVIHVDS